MKTTRLQFLLLLLSMAGSVSVWADTTVEFVFKGHEVISNITTLKSDKVTLSFDVGSGSNKPRTDGTYAYFYKGNTLNITAMGHPIKKVVFDSPSTDSQLSAGDIALGKSTTFTNGLSWSCNGATIYSLDVEQKHSTLRKFKTISVVYDETVSFDQPAPPTFSVEEGVVSKGTKVEITSDIVGASIYYTINGSEPTTSSTQGNSVIVNQDMTIRAIAVMFGISSTVASATYIVPSKGIQYEYVKVTDASTLQNGDVVLVVSEYGSMALGKDAGNFRREAGVTISSDKIVNPSDDVEEITLEKTGSYWYLLTSTGYLYADQKSNNYVKTSTSKQGNFSKASIQITDGNANIKFQGGSTYNSYLQYYGDSKRFSCYYTAPSVESRKVQLYRKVVASDTSEEYVDLTISSIGYATLYYSDKAVVVSPELTAKTYKVENDKMLESKTYLPGDVIPAATGVVFKGNEGVYSLEVTDVQGEADGENMLKGFDEDALTVGNGLFYKLSTYEGKDVGFYWGAENGAAFISKAHKAYLVTPSSVLAKGFALDWTSGVEAIQSSATTNHQVVYTLGGQRMQLATLPKGIYIINGKKMVVR
jgi:hypothetical protein